jgi:hypothetical protein
MHGKRHFSIENHRKRGKKRTAWVLFSAAAAALGPNRGWPSTPTIFAASVAFAGGPTPYGLSFLNTSNINHVYKTSYKCIKCF